MTIVRGLRIAAFVLTSGTLLSAQEPSRYVVPSVAQPQVTKAETGRIVGRVVDASHGTPVAGAKVTISSAAVTVTSAIDGRFVLLNVPVETPVQIQAKAIGYSPKTVTDVVVPNSGGLEQDISLTAEIFKLDAITVTANAERGTVSRALEEMRNAPIIMNTATAEQIAKSPDSDAGQAVKRVSGVTVQDDKYVFVRGLGERYTTTSLNNARIPSPEPERKVVPLDLFPSGLLEGITTSKTFTPEQPGDFSGASVNLKTREFPLGRKVTFSSSVGVNDRVTGKTILRAPTVGQEWLGFSGAARRIPSALGSQPSLAGQSLAQLNSHIASFRDSWSSLLGTGRPNTGFGASVGGEDPVFGQRLGYLASLTYSLSEDAHVNERRALAVADGNGGTRPLNEYKGSTGTSGVLWGGLMNLSTRVGSSTKLSLNNAYTRSADNQASRFSGITEDYGPLDVTRLTFTERAVRSSQLVGEHLIANRHTLDWAATASGVRRYEPDRSDLAYIANVDTASGTSSPLSWLAGPRSATRTFSDLTEDVWDGAANFRLMLGTSRSSVKVGGMGRMATRNADSRAYDILNLGLTDTERSQPIETVLSDTHAQAGLLFLSPSANGGFYHATDRLGAGYAQLEAELAPGVRLVGGARIERAQLLVNSTGAQGASRAKLENTDILPSLAFTFQLTQRQNLRVSATQTLSRPEYRELSDVSYADIIGGLTVHGNPALKRALIQNLDLRWEFYPTGSEVISLGVFAKHFTRPIEKVLVGTTGAPELSFINALGARNYGVEVELRKNLGSFAEALRTVNIFANATMMQSRIETDPDSSSLTNTERSMVGQAPYVVNTGIGYTSPNGRVNATVLYNVVGRRIVEAGLLPRPDTYEEARHVLDVSLDLPFIARGQIKLDAKNLLDQPYRTTQGSVVRNEYHAGRSFSLGLSWKF